MPQFSRKAARAAALSAAGIALFAAGSLVFRSRSLVTVSATPSEGAVLQTGFGHLALARPATYANLTVYPVYSDQSPSTAPKQAEFVTLAEGLDRGSLRASEPDSRCVPGLGAAFTVPAGMTFPDDSVTNAEEGQEHRNANVMLVTNVAPKPTYVPDGQVVPGGGQDRGAAADTIIPARSAQVQVPAFCVEAKRSTGPSADFRKTVVIAMPSVRYAMQVTGEQQPVWNAVAQATTHFGAHTQSGTYAALAQAPAAQAATVSYATALTVPVQSGTPGRVIGVVAAINGHIVCADLYRDPALFAQMWPSLLRSYALQAAISRPSHTAEPLRDAEAARWLAALDTAPGTPSRACDLSRAARVQSADGAGVRVAAISATGGSRLSLLHEAFWTPAAVLNN